MVDFDDRFEATYLDPRSARGSHMHPRLERDIAPCKSAAVLFLRDFDFRPRNAFRSADRVYRGGITAASSLLTPQAGIETAAPN